MLNFTVIQYLLAIIIGLYISGLLFVWIFELRKNAVYCDMQRKLRNIEELRLSAAIEYAKVYKVRHDFRRKIQLLEEAQKFVLSKVLFIAQPVGKTEKIGYKH